MSFLILVRHGQSVWNLEKRFTGWVDVDLTAQGKAEAEKAGILIKDRNIKIDFYYSSACPTPRKIDLKGRAQTIPDKR